MCPTIPIEPELTADKPNVARIYDYWLGGYHNFEVDRQRAQRVMQICPVVAFGAQANRAFLRRVVRFFAEQGITQFLDLGSGIPTVGNVHEIAQQCNPEAHVVYVDIDPVAVAHSDAILRENSRACVIQADVQQPQDILGNLHVKRLIDFRKPAAILFLTILHYVLDDELACSVVRAMRDVLAPGSYIALSHLTYEDIPDETRRGFETLYASAATPTIPRTRAQIGRFFEGFQLLEPGVVPVPQWRPEGPDDLMLDTPWLAMALAGVARKD